MLLKISKRPHMYALLAVSAVMIVGVTSSILYARMGSHQGTSTAAKAGLSKNIGTKASPSQSADSSFSKTTDQSHNPVSTPPAKTSTKSTTTPPGNTTNSPGTANSGGSVPVLNPIIVAPKPGGSTAPQSLNCAPNPHLCGFPDATNTGVRAGVVLRRVPQDVSSGPGWHYDSRGWIAVDTAGAVFSGFITGLNVDVTADNVTISDNQIIVGGDTFGVSVRHSNNVTVQYNEIAGTNTSNGRQLVSVKDIYGDTANLKVLANNMYYVSTAVQMDAGLIQDNYIHDMGLISGDHINGTTANGGSTLLKIIHNTSFNQFDQTDAISLFEDFGVQANRIIDNNLVAGGGYCIYGGQNPGGPTVSNIQITNNHFARLFYPNCGSFGYIAAWNPTAPGAVWSGNIWDDTGVSVLP